MHAPQTELILRHAGAELAHTSLPPGEYVIGRSPEVELYADTPLLSRRHARLTIGADHLLLEDLGSANGTFVAGQRITDSTRLLPDQPVQLGDVSLEIRGGTATIHPPSPDTPTMLAPALSAVPPELREEKRYAIGAQIARGGMGAILDAQQAAMKRQVAMKVMLAGPSEEDIRRFVEEAQVTGRLEHPNIVPVHELGLDEHGQPFYTMKMVRGITLKKVLELLGEGLDMTVKKYPLAALLTIFQKACDAVAFAHSRGVIHRDLKPENIMLGDFGEVLVMDWGLAKIAGGSSQSCAAAEAGLGSPAHGQTLAGTIMGTPAYMSPEQARGEIDALDTRSDIYALGAILFEFLHLRPTVTGLTAMHIVDLVGRGEVEPFQGAALSKPPAAVENRRSSLVPDSLLAVVRQAMAFERDQRYWTVEELQADLTAYQAGFATSAENASLGRQLLLLIKRHQAATLGAAAVLLVGVTLGTKALVEGRRAEREAVRANAEARRANHTLAELKKTAPKLLALAESEAGFQRFDSALEKLAATLALDPEIKAAWWRRAWVLLAQEKFAESAHAVRAAQERDPAHAARLGAILPVLVELQAAPAGERWHPVRSSAVLAHLKLVEASGEAIALSKRFQLSSAEEIKLVQERIKAWLGREYGGVYSDGTISVSGLPKTIDPLRVLSCLSWTQSDLLDSH